MPAAEPSAAGEPTLRDGFHAGLPFVLPTMLIGVSFGVYAESVGWGWAAPILASLLIYSGSAQYAVASVLGAGGSGGAAIIAATLVNARFLPMGIALAPSMKGGRVRRALEAQANIDASWAVASQGGGRFSRELLLGATLPQYFAWAGGTVLGLVVGDVVADPDAYGLDVLFPAFFLGLLIEELRSRQAIVVAALAATLAFVLIPVTPPGVPVISACLVALLGLRR